MVGEGKGEIDRSRKEKPIREVRTGREAGSRGEDLDSIGSLTLRRDQVNNRGPVRGPTTAVGGNREPRAFQRPGKQGGA